MWAEQTDDFDVETWEPPYFGELPPKEPEVEHHLPTAAEVAAIEEAAREAGHAAGFEKGYQEGRERGQREAEQETQARADRELKASVAALESIAQELSDPLASAADDIEPELLTLVTTLAQRVIMAELDSRAELVRGVLHQALEQLPARHAEVRVRVNPEDLAVVETYAEDQGERIRWFADSEMTRGGCLVEAGPSRIDASVETRIAQAVDAIWGELSRPPADQGDQGESDDQGDQGEQADQHEQVTEVSKSSPSDSRSANSAGTETDVGGTEVDGSGIETNSADDGGERTAAAAEPLSEGPQS
nr:FliH/SctL family protein [Thiorhodovibrio winogradskyi]